MPVCLNAKTLCHILLKEKAEVFHGRLAAVACLDGPVSPTKHFSPFGFSSMPGKFLQTKLLPEAAAALAPAGAAAGLAGAATGATGAATRLPPAAAGLA